MPLDYEMSPGLSACRVADPPAGLAKSFRDPDGFLFSAAGRLFRAVRSPAFETLKLFLETPLARQWQEHGRFVGTRVLPDEERAELLERGELRPFRDALAGHCIVEHDRVAFPSFPEEWPPEILYAAAELTLDLAEDVLDSGSVLKDASPYNVLLRGSKPVFVDVLSVEPRDPLDVLWRPYSQFVRTFLLPLAVDRKGLRPAHQVFSTSREGLEPGDVYAALSKSGRLAPPWLSLVSMPVWFSGRERDGLYRPHRVSDSERAAFVQRRLLRGLRAKLKKLAPRARKESTWSGYLETERPYQDDQLQAKMSFVEAALRTSKPTRVLDVGCNTGRFSELAARSGADVVAIDGDPGVVGTLWRRAGSESLSILPLVVNFSRPTPATGWCNRECASFLDRARGSFDALMMLAVLHHLLITDRVPLGEILRLAAELTTRWLIVEWVEPEDRMFQRLLRGRDALYAHLRHEYFESCAAEWFDLVERRPVDGSHRILYLMRRRG
ncbi:MAG: class I SAM-dependent methyltransferase [Bryobacteraceae bacterium]